MCGSLAPLRLRAALSPWRLEEDSLPIRPIKVAVHAPEQSAPPTEWLAEVADSALGALSLPLDACVEVVITDDETVRELNLRHRGIDATTDVLSFAAAGSGEEDFVIPPDSADEVCLGEVVISLPEATRQANSNGRACADEVAFLLAHGILHLVGHDHEEPDERGVMEAEHRKLLSAMLGSRASDITVKYPA